MEYSRAGMMGTLVLAALSALPAIAEAATVSSAGSVIDYRAAAGETNDVVVDDPDATYTFAETLITAGAGCTQNNANLVTCSDSGIGTVLMRMGDMNDTASATDANQDPFLILGESGDDTLTASAASSDFIHGGTNGAGGDEMGGGAGIDFVGWDTGCTVPIFVDINDVNDDGGCDGSPLTDDVHTDVENLQGENTNDTLIGSPGSNILTGGGGNDRLDGGDNGDADDDFRGGSGIDRVVFGSIPGHTYPCTSQAVSVDLDNTFDDDSCADASSDDNIVRPDVESVTGSTLADTITGSCFPNTFAGDPGTTDGSTGGDDTLIGDPAGCLAATTDGTEADFFGGGEGNDTFNGDGSGNAGFDTVTYGAPYTGHAVTGGTCLVTVNRAVSVTFDDAANDCDGFGNTADNVNGDINRLIGSPLADSIDATAADQDVQLFGRLGDDLMIDSAFNDLLNGEGGTDTANCPGAGANVSLNNEGGSC